MASLDQFTDTSAASLDQFQVEGNLYPVSNEKSNKNLAAYTAALSGNPDSVEATYLQAANDMNTQGKSELVQKVQDQANKQSMGMNRDALLNIMADPTIPDSQKQSAAIAALDATNELYNVRNMTSEAALIDDSKDETHESENVRISLADTIDQVNRDKLKQQALLNRELAKTDSSTLKTGVDIAEMLIPFAESENVGAILNKAKGGDKVSQVKAIALLGSGKVDLKNTLKRLPPEKRQDMTRKVIDLINNSPGVILSDNNQFAKADLLRTMLQDGYYDNLDKWVDNVTSLLDMTVLGGPIARGIEFLRGARTAEKAAGAGKAGGAGGMEGDYIPGSPKGPQSPSGAPQVEAGAVEGEVVGRKIDAGQLSQEKASKDYVKSEVQPVSLAENYKDTNPEKSRAANEVAGQSDEAAQAYYGTTRTEAIANDGLPEIHKSDESVKNKTSIPDKETRAAPPPRPRIMDYVEETGAIHLSDEEKLSAATRVVNDFNNAVGIVARKEMNVPRADSIGGKITVDVTYGPKDMGWRNGQDAIEHVKLSLRDYGVKDKDITLLQRVGSEYKPVKVSDATQEGDYLVRVNYPYRITSPDINDWSDYDVKYNVLDRKPHTTDNTGGTFQRHILKAHSMLHPNLSLGANVAVDKAAGIEKVLLEQSQDFAKPYTKLPKDRQQLIEQVIKESNLKGKVPSKTKLKADGFSDEEINILRAWKDTWDTMYWMENADLGRTLSNRGYGVLEDATSDSRVFAKKVSRQQAGGHQRVLDLSTGEMRNFSDSELTDLYNAGGHLARMRQKIKVGDETAEFTFVNNMPNGSYIRKIREDDAILNYREGYYTVYYKEPHFIEKIVKDSKGNELYRRAVATAATRREADLLARRLKATDGEDYNVRGDVKKMRFDSDQNWDLQVASGRTAQRIRGERLEDASSPITDPSHNNVMGPVDSMIVSARSVSNRVAMRDYLESAKARAIQQYGEFFPKGPYGDPQFPSSAKKVSAPGREYDKRVADARTTVEYINYLENGYISAIDEGYKAGLQAMANAAGLKHWDSVEKALRAASEAPGPTAVGKNLSFTLYLALNPLRQLIVQSQQSLQLFALSPRYVGNQMAKDVGAFTEKIVKGEFGPLARTASGRTEAELEEMWTAYQKSGLAASIDKHDLVKGALTEMAENSRIAGRKDPISRGIAFSRRIGFDAGEWANMTTSWLTHYDMAKKAAKGRKLTAKDYDQIAAKARDYTYNMNRAGSYAYTENSLSIVFQFQQVIHSAIEQMTLNRNISKAQKAKLIGLNVLLFGAPAGSMLYNVLQPILPDDGEIRDMIVQGLEGFTINKVLSLATGYDVGIDFSGMAASDTMSLYKFVSGLMTSDIGEIAANTPTGGLLFGGNARLTNFAKEVGQYFRFIDPVDEKPPTTGEVFLELGKLSSGFSNAYKAIQVAEYQKKYNSYGGVVSKDITPPEVVAQAFGFNTLAEVRGYYINQKAYEESKAFKEDVKKAYKEAKRGLTKEGITPEQLQWVKRMNNWSFSVFKDSDKAMSIIHQQMKYDVENNQDGAMFNFIMRQYPFLDVNTTKDIINNSDMDESKKQALRDQIDFIERYKKED